MPAAGKGKLQVNGEEPGWTISGYAPKSVHDAVAAAVAETDKSQSFVVVEAIRRGLPGVLRKFGRQTAKKAKKGRK
jgi:hypothetical protein